MIFIRPIHTCVNEENETLIIGCLSLWPIISFRRRLLGILCVIDPILSCYPQVRRPHGCFPLRSVCIKRDVELKIRSFPQITPEKCPLPNIIIKIVFGHLANAQNMITKVVVLRSTTHTEDFIVQLILDQECTYSDCIPDAYTKKNQEDEEILHIVDQISLVYDLISFSVMVTYIHLLFCL